MVGYKQRIKKKGNSQKEYLINIRFTELDLIEYEQMAVNDIIQFAELY